MGNYLGGNKIDNHVLLLGCQMSGKTHFLYENLIKGKKEFSNLTSSQGYNYEIIKTDKSTYALWDIPDNESFKGLQSTFIKSIPFIAVIYMISPFITQEKEKFYLEQNIIKSKVEQEFEYDKQTIANSRYYLNILVKDSSIKYETTEEKIIKTNDIIEDVKILIKFNELTQTKCKGITLLDAKHHNELYEQAWHQFDTLIKNLKDTYYKEEEEEEQKNQKK